MKKSTNCFFYISLISALLILFSCSTDDVSDFGRSIIEDRSQGGLHTGEFKTIGLPTPRTSFRSVVDEFSGQHIYNNILRGGGASPSMWAIGNWQKDTTILKFRHFGDTTQSISRFLQGLTRGDTVAPHSIKAELRWANVAELNSFDLANVEIGTFFDTLFFPLNFALTTPRSAISSVPITLDSYLLHERGTINHGTTYERPAIDTAFITRINAEFTNFVDTVSRDSVFTRPMGGSWGYNPGDHENEIRINGCRVSPNPDSNCTPFFNLDDRARRMFFTSDDFVTWRQLVPANAFNRIDTTVNNAGDTIFTLFHDDNTVASITQSPVDTIFRANDFDDFLTWDVRGDTLVYMEFSSHLIINFVDTIVYRTTTSRSNIQLVGETEREVRNTTRFRSAFRDGNTIADTLKQTGMKYITEFQAMRRSRADDIVINGIGGVDLWDIVKDRTLRDTLNMYLRINKESQANILHLRAPVLRISWSPAGDTTIRRGRDIQFDSISVVARSEDNLQDTANSVANSTPVISAAMQRFAEIDLDFGEFFDKISAERFLHIGLADLHLLINKAGTDFPVQYGDSIPINAIISEVKLTPESLFELPAERRINSAWLRRNNRGEIADTLKLPIVSTLGEFVRRHEIYSKPAPQKAYLYLWIDGHRMGRVLFGTEPNINFTYILQTRRDGE